MYRVLVEAERVDYVDNTVSRYIVDFYFGFVNVEVGIFTNGQRNLAPLTVSTAVPANV